MLKRSTAPTFESLEKRQMLAVSPVIAGTKVKGVNLSSDGISTNQTLITVPFTGNINIADASKIQVRGYAINPLTGKQKKMVVPVVATSVLAADNRYLQITTGCLMRKGGKIILYSGGLTDDNGDTLAEQTVAAVKGQNKERFTLARRAFVPTDYTKFSPDLFSQAPTPSTLNSAIDETTVTTNLTAFLQKKVDLGIITAATRDAALARYNSATTKSIIPDANMRAAMVSLVGTVGEAAIASYLDGKNLSGKPYTIIAFDTTPDGTVPVAQTMISSTGRLRTIVKPEFKGEPFQVLAVHLAHEAIHQDSTVVMQEEEAANVVETLCYAQQVAVDSSVVSLGSKLVVRENERLMAVLNSGRRIFPYVGLSRASLFNSLGNIFPTGKTPSGGTYNGWENFIQREYAARGAPNGTSDTNPTWAAMYQAITGSAAPAGQKFSDGLIATIDSFQQVIGTKAAITLAGYLRLSVV